MNFDLDDTQQEIRSLADDVFGRLATPSRLEAVEATPDRFDRELWGELARVGLLGVTVAEDYDGLGLGLVELSLVCEQLGRAVAPVPYVATASIEGSHARVSSGEDYWGKMHDPFDPKFGRAYSGSGQY